MKRIILRAVIGAATTVWLSSGAIGCATIGKKFDVAPVTRLQIGETTMEEVREMFGTPWRTGIDDGRRTWTYGHYRYSIFSRAKTRDLVIRFENGVVYSYTFNSTEPEDSAG